MFSLVQVSAKTPGNSIAGQSHVVSIAFARHSTLAFQKRFEGEKKKKRSYVRELKEKKITVGQNSVFNSIGSP